MNKQEILAKYGLDFQIEKLPMLVNHNGEEIKSSYFGLLNTKTNEVINTVKDSYRVTQNDEILEVVLQGMKGFGELSLHLGGSIHGGRKTFYQLGIEGTSKVGDDILKNYVTVIDSNDGTSGLSVGVGNLTMSCQNQFFKFYKAGQYKGRHSASIEQMIIDLPKLIRLSLSETMKLNEYFNELARKNVSPEFTHKLVNALVGLDRTMKADEIDKASAKSRNAMHELYAQISTEMNQKGQNAWGLFSGVTRWTTHTKATPTRPNGRIESSMLGTNYKTNQLGLEVVSELVGLKTKDLILM